MIAKLKKKLVLQYTLIIVVLLACLSALALAAIRYNNSKIILDALVDYLEEEAWEASESDLRSLEIHAVNGGIGNFTSYTYWFENGVLRHAEEPSDEVVAQKIRTYLTETPLEDGQVYLVSFKNPTIHHGGKWRFYLMKKSVSYRNGAKGNVFALYNYTPLKKSGKYYLKLFIFLSLGLVVVSWLVGRIFVKKSISYIEAMYEKQKNFVSNASHELRTPLSLLMGMTELLEYKSKSPELTAEMKNEIEYISKLLDMLLQLSKGDNKKLELHKETVDLTNEIADYVRQTELIYGKGVIRLRSRKKVLVSADRTLLRQLFSILADNAVKYTPEDKRIVFETGTEGGHVVLRCSDNGIGISPRDLPHIFERFWQADDSHHKKGQGLGLSLAEVIVDLHGGSIRVQSEPGKGSVFEILLPM